MPRRSTRSSVRSRGKCPRIFSRKKNYKSQRSAGVALGPRFAAGQLDITYSSFVYILKESWSATVATIAYSVSLLVFPSAGLPSVGSLRSVFVVIRWMCLSLTRSHLCFYTLPDLHDSTHIIASSSFFLTQNTRLLIRRKDQLTLGLAIGSPAS